MDITPQSDQHQPISDDQELAKALAGVMPDVPEPVVMDEPASAAAAAPDPMPDDQQASSLPPIEMTVAPMPEPTPAVVTEPTPAPAFTAPTASSDLESIKKNALGELRPLIDHVDLPAEEKFDTYLMLIRSTDDSTLIAPAHAAAQGISDEKRRAEALLDIIKEIDYLSRNNQPVA
jgi:hypothetical protein